MGAKKDEFMGGVKEGLGKLTGNDTLEAEGTAQKKSGETRRKAGGAMHEMSGSLKKGAGKVLGSPTLKAQGEAEKVQGKLERS